MRSLIYIVLVTAAFVARFYFTRPSSCGAACEVGVITVSAKEFSDEITGDDTTVIDIRTQDEFEGGHIKDAVNSDFYKKNEFNKFLDSLNKSNKYLIYCRTGNRSGQALKIMEDKGFENVVNLDGGIVSWQSEGLPLVK